MPPCMCLIVAHIQGAFYQFLYPRLDQITLTVDHLSLFLFMPSAIGMSSSRKQPS